MILNVCRMSMEKLNIKMEKAWNELASFHFVTFKDANMNQQFSEAESSRSDF